jgi:hypothetical protein
MTALVMHGTFVAGNRRRIVYRVLDDGQQLGTAVCWTAFNTLYPWGLTIPTANVINFGFASRADMMRAVQGFVANGRTGGRHV